MRDNFRHFRAGLLSWSKANARQFPWRRTRDPYKICVAEIMLHQTFARKVVPVYKAFTARYPSPRELSRANVAFLEKMIRPLGLLYRARRLKEIARCVMAEHGGKFPKDMAGLLSLPGVGDYSASAIMCFAYGAQAPIIDANVVRVYSRYFGIDVKLPSSAPNKELLEIARRVLPGGKAREFNYALLDFAAAVCSHYNPKHEGCPVRKRCKHMAALKR